MYPKLFFDIETIPCHAEKKDAFLKILRKKLDESNKGKKDKIEKTDEELYRETSLEGTFGRICCIAFIKETGNGKGISKVLSYADERQILDEFWKVITDVREFVGHNIIEFDLPFIYKRSIILGVKPSRQIKLVKFKTDEIFDTMKEWEKWAYGKSQKLDTLAQALDLPTSKDDMDGSLVWEFFQKGKFDEIGQYCMKDVVLTRRVYNKMNYVLTSNPSNITEKSEIRVEVDL